MMDADRPGLRAARGGRGVLRSAGVAGFIVLLTFAAYVPAIEGDFVIGDDSFVSGNALLPAPDGLYRIWCTTESQQYHPLTFTSYWLEYRLWGLRPSGYHAVNIALHAASAVLVWVLLDRLGARGAVIAALVWALHPVNVESVAWIFERKNVLSGLFFFLSLLALQHFGERGAWKWYVIGSVLFVLAMLSKQSTVVLPAVLLLYWWWDRRAWRMRNILAGLPLFALALGMSWLTIWYERSVTGARGAEFETAWIERLARAPWFIGFYVHKLLVPGDLMFFYPRWSVDPTRWTSYAPHAGMLAVFIVLLVKRQKWGRTVLLGTGYYLITLFPVLGFFDLVYHRTSFVADHFQYLASAGLVGLCVHGAAWGVERFRQRMHSARLVAWRSTAAVPGVLVIGVCGLLTWQRCHAYQNNETLARDTLRHDPSSWAANYTLAEHLVQHANGDTARLEEARDCITRALAQRPDDPKILSGLGIILALLGDSAAAEMYLEQAAERAPASAERYFDLGLVRLQQGEAARAVPAFAEAVRLDPTRSAAQFHLGWMLAESGRIEEGLEHLRIAQRLAPGDQRVTSLLREVDQLRLQQTSRPATAQ